MRPAKYTSLYTVFFNPHNCIKLQCMNSVALRVVGVAQQKILSLFLGQKFIKNVHIMDLVEFGNE